LVSFLIPTATAIEHPQESDAQGAFLYAGDSGEVVEVLIPDDTTIVLEVMLDQEFVAGAWREIPDQSAVWHVFPVGVAAWGRPVSGANVAVRPGSVYVWIRTK
jgi:hypothetical protein